MAFPNLQAAFQTVKIPTTRQSAHRRLSPQQGHCHSKACPMYVHSMFPSDLNGAAPLCAQRHASLLHLGAAPQFFLFLFAGSIRHYFPSPGRRSGTALARITGISPLRGSLRAAPIACVCGWAGVSLCSDGVVAKQLATAVFVWMGTAGHLIWPSFIRTLSAQVVLAHPTDRFPVFRRVRQGTYSSRRI